ncbi:nuclear transport factor 2 family protein [Arthrobacter cupressi]|uniref:Predicted SnoaL-like aldol condensation-catalyzing enzyme n=1 Tax=Arthrobacter cupressi TaxID=1045773 RepID=A0A1G8VWP4_9MICC|nr:nuclear transport factor 2 family protein [Arthrobacter cupressi]NYD78603.1 putative SnoaL-like aldol condensation-catalyzing enzyme [Arthrobacter cupressi]SDJ69905.1 Predicted SnoaL-like aldol condensation-catalyzing enzyme [Arthrobacter cupressi]
MNNKDLVQQAGRELFIDRDTGAIDRWWSANYRQHSALAGDGPEALRALVENVPPDFQYEPVRIFADGDLVAMHGIYRGFGPVPLVAFDIFRVADGKLAEHWDALQPAVAETASGRSQTEGPVEVTAPEQTEASRAVVLGFIDAVLTGRDPERIAEFISSEQYLQHNPSVPDGLDGLRTALTAWAEQGITVEYSTVHRSVAEGEFVLTQSEGLLGGKPTAFYDLFRVDGGKLVEHWDVVAEIPESLPHGNGLF